jgi:predicted ATPase/signal transduction histidine kinase/ActR/RegA family two-component response regulator
MMMAGPIGLPGSSAMHIDSDPGGYRLRGPVQESTTTIVHRAERERDGRAVILKMLKREAATPGAVARYRHELEVLESLRIPGVVEVLGLEVVQGLPMLVLEDFGATSLARLRREQRFDPGLGLERVLDIASRLGDILGEVHDRGVIHCDVNPANILLNPDTGALKLADFGSSRRSTDDPTVPGSTIGLVGTLAYMAPEQTGRMNRPVDYRADLYSLGVTLYELCTGRLPFDTGDALELVHCHLARHPVPVHELEPGIPEAISDIVSRLMAKMPEERYQSAGGCAHDLRACQRQLQAGGQVARFALGEHDVVARFEIPPTLYGREREQHALRAAAARVSAGARELLLVAGQPGVGKSALVRELAAPGARGPAHFIEGKFDQYQRNVPYSALASAFGDLVSQLLTEPEERLARWRGALREALGPSGQVLVEVIPDLTFLLGPQPPVARLGPAETEHRFHILFERFLEVLCSAEHPLLLFLDDLQWADTASLRLMQRMMLDPAVHHLLIIGSYRDDEIDAAHPLTRILDQLRAEHAAIERIELGPLGLEHVRQLLGVSVQRSPDDCAALAELVLAKTEGNPFFVGQFLRSLHQERLLVFDRALRGWRWDLAAVRALGITDNVVDLMIERIRKLPAATQRALELAACAGNTFDTTSLAILCEDDPAAIHCQLQPAVAMGLLVPLPAPEARPTGGAPATLTGAPATLTGAHAFAHDRVQQAAYALVAGAERSRIHLRIARLLAQAQREQGLFELAEHYVLGAELLDDPAERLAVARLCLAAGQRAQASMARDSALRFLRAGRALLPASAWQEHYELARELALATLEAEYLTDHLDEAGRLSEELLASARDVLDKVAVHEIQNNAQIFQGRLAESLATAHTALGLLGVELPREPAARQALVQELRAALDLDEATFAALEHLPTLTDRHEATVVRILARASMAAYLSDPVLWELVVAITVERSMRRGVMAVTALSYAYYGGLLCGMRRDLERGYRFSALATRLSDRFSDPVVAVKVDATLYFLVLPWSRPLRELVEPHRALVQRALQVGDIEAACFVAVQCSKLHYFLGEPLDDVHREQLAYLALMERHRVQYARALAGVWERLVRALLSPTGFASEPEDLVPNRHHRIYQCCSQTILRYVAGEYEAALEVAQKGAQCATLGTGTLIFAEHTVWYSLAILAALPAEPERARPLLAEVERNQALLGRWAERAPDNFRHQHILIEAERARVGGDAVAAMTLYDEAIESARAGGYLCEEAVAAECAARFYAGRGRAKVMRAYLEDAYHGYRRWGAQAKVHRLEAQHPWLARRQLSTIESSTASTPSSSGSSQLLDVESVVRASQAISSQLVLDALLAELMKIIVENAGAQRGYLLLVQGGGLAIEAEGDAGAGRYRALPSLALDQHAGALALSAVSYVARTRKSLVLRDAGEQEPFARDPYIRAHRPRSLLCAPITRHGQLVGIVYLENSLIGDAFTPTRVDIVQMLASQAAISLENARLLHTLRLSKEDAERAREDAERAREDAERASRAKSEFLASVNHELRTPMNGIIGMIELLRGTRLDDEQTDYLATARTSAEQLMRIIRDTLDLSRIEAGRLDLEPIRFTLTDCLATLERMLVLRIQAQGLTFVRDVAPDVPALVVGDRDRLLQILINLLGNAIKFTPPGGAVSLHVRVIGRADDHVLLGFDVRDTGIGIAAAEQAQIFQPFTQVRAPGAPAGGSGLGLAIASRLVALMEGAISVESEPGEGSCFSFTARFGVWEPELAQPAPPAQAQAAQAAQAAGPTGQASTISGHGGGMRVLVVEDNQVNQLVAVRLLGMDGHSCAVAENGAEALRLLESEPFDAVLMDVLMPIMDGHTTTREIRLRERGTGRHIPIIAVTASATTEIVAECAASGMDHFLSKPLRIDAIRALLQRIRSKA